jgi:hypothetical protein
MSFWIPLRLEMKLGVFITLLNRSVNEVQEVVTTWFKGQAAGFYVSGI